MPDMLVQKQLQFNSAMEKYENLPVYKIIGQIVSFVNVSSQAILALLVFRQPIGPIEHLFTFVAAYVLADFINGLVHMYMDNNDDYVSIIGPLVASFHLHHSIPRYKQRPVLVVYYQESGAKIWLAFLMLISVFGVWTGVIAGVAAYGILYFSILSCIAEVSHYLCHIPNPKAAKLLKRIHLLLAPRHHIRHHIEDNVNYAFLNGMTDPLINIIAKYVYRGYKNTTDLHYASYTGAGSKNRE